jgi:hypothetical protein
MKKTISNIMANKGFVGTQVTAFVIIIASSFLAVGAATGSEALVASQVTWQEHFGSSTADTNTLFSLMAHGYFRAESTSVQRVVDTWLKDHPKAVVISVSTGGPVMTRFPSSRLTYVWVVQGSDSLNVELVRRGCIAPETQILNPDEKPEVSQKDYELFIKRVAKAREIAKEHKIGIWQRT